jgi:hypothetical protein
MTSKKIGEDHLESINQKSANTQRLDIIVTRNALMENLVIRPITELRSFIIQTNTKQSFVHHT